MVIVKLVFLFVFIFGIIFGLFLFYYFIVVYEFDDFEGNMCFIVLLVNNVDLRVWEF